MKLLKKILAVFTFLFVFTVMAVNMSVKALTETEHIVTDSFVDVTSAGTLTNGFKINAVGGVQSGSVKDVDGSTALSNSFAKFCYAKTSSNYVQSPNISTQTNSYNLVKMDMTIAALSTDAAVECAIVAYDSSNAELDRVTFNTTAKKSSVFVDYSNIEISTIDPISYVRFLAPTTINNKSIVIKSMTVKYYDYVLEDGDANISFYSGETLINKKVYESGSTITYKPNDIPNHKYFVGWYTDAALSTPLPENYTVDGTISSLYAKFDELSDHLDSSNMSVHSGGNATHINNSIFNIIDTKGDQVKIEANTGMVLPNGEKCSFRINKATSKTTDYVLSFIAPFNGFVKIWACDGAGGSNFLVCEDTYSTSAYVGIKESTTKNELFEMIVPIESGKTYIVGGTARYYIYGLFAEQAKLTAGTSFGTSTVDGTKAVRFVGSLVKEGITASDITSVTATISISGSAKAATVKDVTTTVDTSIGTLAAEAENTLYFYTSVYGFENTDYDTRVLTVVFDVTFTDGSVISKRLTYTINYAEM